MEIGNLIGFPVMILFHSYGGGGILSGFLHPLLGIDHLLAMLAVGILSAQIGGRALWTVPATFVGTMAVGAFLGIAGVAVLQWFEAKGQGTYGTGKDNAGL